ncbi:MAG: hypothetical protein ABI533_00035 [Betaproteobacteria bacterium]
MSSVREFPRSHRLSRAPGNGRRLRWAIAVVAAVALIGCAAPRGGDESADVTCNSAQQCRVEVRVDCSKQPCRIVVDHPNVFARGNDIVWTVVNNAGQSYAFSRDDGVAFKSAAGRAAFSCHREANQARFACMNHRTPGRFEYAIRLDGSPPVGPLDPWVVN